MPNFLRKKPRTLRPNQILTQWHNLEQSNKQIRQAVAKETQAIAIDPEKFCEQILGFTPYSYQKEFIDMFQNNQFTAARWCRQSGKTFIIATMLLWYATTHPQTAIAIVGPSWRQSKRILQRIAAFTHNLPPNIAFKPQRTQIHFTNGSTIEAFPNNPDTIRGPTFNIVYCLPAGVKVTLANGNQVPIEQLKPGQIVLSYNHKTREIEPKHVLRTFCNPRAFRKIIRINHMKGTIDCTAEHKIYTLSRGYINSSRLCKDDKILYLAIKTKSQTGPNDQITECNVLSTSNCQRDDGERFVYDLEVEDNHKLLC